ncbi:MAG TPA: hypothetical protein VEU76_00380 [Candidatus Udaeobacter sp.]|nr:hypothetical protein [Candidatus Udaeobacter sp.]
MSSKPSYTARLIVVVVAVAILAGMITLFITGFILKAPYSSTLTSEAASHPRVANAAGQPETVIHVEVVGAVGSAIEYPRPDDPHPTWVGYLPTTTFKVPANSIVTMVVDQEDTPSGLRNPVWAKAQGIIGGTFHMTYFDDQGAAQEGDFSSIDDPANAAHTFAIPDLGVFVPLEGLNANAPANSMNVITFSFRVGKAGVYRWQCFVPCGSGTIYGNGGPMQTIGYMGGFLVVQ